MRCQICNSGSGDFAAVISGEYYASICSRCKLDNAKVSSGHARWSRGEDLLDHEHEIQQPYNADGTINTKFARLYPKQAKALFTEEQLRDASR